MLTPLLAPVLLALVTADPKAELQAMLDAQTTAWNAGQLEEFVRYYAPETRFYSGGTITVGRDAVLERYRKSYQQDGREMGTVAFSELDMELFTPTAGLVRGRWAVTTKTGTIGGLFTLLCRKTDAGWRITHDHTSRADPEPKP